MNQNQPTPYKINHNKLEIINPRNPQIPCIRDPTWKGRDS